mgnify:CR=1 FL=1
MSSFLDYDVVYPKKGTDVIFDRRKFRKQRTGREKTLMDIVEACDRLGKRDTFTTASKLLQIPNVYQLNKDLLCIVYEYYYSKEGDKRLREILANFENDFQEILRSIRERGLFKKLKDEKSEYLFRQDFCCYLFLINDFNENFEESSEYYDYVEYEDSEDEFLDAEMDEEIDLQGD